MKRIYHLPALILIFTCMYAINAFICDDAFISFRTIDNFVRGYGLRWNIGERVQVFTNPLYTFFMTVLYFITYDRSWLPNPHRIWMTSLLLSYFFSASVIVILWRFVKNLQQVWLTFCILMTSQAYVSFCASGLETSLSYVLISLFYLLYFHEGKISSRLPIISVYSLIVALAMVNRIDTIVILLPAFLHIFYKATLRLHYKAYLITLISMTPLFLWFGFSIIYFGFFFPNSYYAKIGLNIHDILLLQNGIQYALHCLYNDPITISIIFIATIGSILLYRHSKDIRFILAQVGGISYVGYVIKIGGDFLGYRFFSLPFLVSTLVLTSTLFIIVKKKYHHQLMISAIFLCISYSLLLPASPLRVIRETPTQPDISYYFQSSALKSWRPGKVFPFSQFHAVIDVNYGYKMRVDTFRVSVSGGGIRGFVRGPNDHLLDPQSITDPLMARLPIFDIHENFHPGHIMKPIPAGYVESIREQKNLIKDPILREYYRKLSIIISGSIWSKERWHYITEFNFTNQRRYRDEYLFMDPPYEYDRR